MTDQFTNRIPPDAPQNTSLDPNFEEGSASTHAKPVIWVYSTDPSIITGNDYGGYPHDQAHETCFIVKI